MSAVNAHHRNSVADYKRMNAFHLLVARGVRTYVSTIVFGIAAFAFLLIALIVKNYTFLAGAAALFLLAAAWPFITLAMQNGKISKYLRENRTYEKSEQFFTFGESGFHLKICADGREEEYDIPYEQVLRIYERADRFYIYIGRAQALILKKDEIEGGGTALTPLFVPLGKRFRGRRRQWAMEADGKKDA